MLLRAGVGRALLGGMFCALLLLVFLAGGRGWLGGKDEDFAASISRDVLRSDYGTYSEKAPRELEGPGAVEESRDSDRIDLVLRVFPLVYSALKYGPKLTKVEIEGRSATVEIIFSDNPEGESLAMGFHFTKDMDEETPKSRWRISGIDSNENLYAAIENQLRTTEEEVYDSFAGYEDFRESFFALLAAAEDKSVREVAAEIREDLERREIRLREIAVALRAFGEANPGEGGPDDLVEGLFPEYVDVPEKLAMPAEDGAGEPYFYNPPRKDVGSHGTDHEQLVLLDSDRDVRFGRFGLFENGSVRLLSKRNIIALAEAVDSREDEPCGCGSNENILKEWGLIMKMYSNEGADMLFPPVAEEPGNLMVDGTTVYPEYCTDIVILVNPIRPNADALRDRLFEEPLDVAHMVKRFDDTSYFYLGYAASNEAEGLLLCDAFRRAAAEGRRLTEDLQVAPGAGNFGGDTIYRLREDIDRFFITYLNNPVALAMVRAYLPTMWERPLNGPGETPLPINVLYFDGHVDRVPPGMFPNTEAFQKALLELDALGEDGR